MHMSSEGPALENATQTVAIHQDSTRPCPGRDQVAVRSLRAVNITTTSTAATSTAPRPPMPVSGVVPVLNGVRVGVGGVPVICATAVPSPPSLVATSVGVTKGLVGVGVPVGVG